MKLLKDEIELQSNFKGKVIPFKKINNQNKPKRKNVPLNNDNNNNNIFKRKSLLRNQKDENFNPGKSSSRALKKYSVNNNLLKIKEPDVLKTIQKKNNSMKLRIGIIKKTDNELNFGNYLDAVANDKRKCCQFYLSLLITKHLLFFPFTSKNDFNASTIKICFLFLMLEIILILSVLFIDDLDLHELFISKGAFNIPFHLNKIIYEAVITLILKDILLWTIFTENNFLKIKKLITLEKFNLIHNEMAYIHIKCVCFFPISIILLSIFWIYFMCFSFVFRNAYFYILKMTAINCFIQLVIPIIVNIIPSIIRMYSLKGIKNRACLYRFSQILQIM